jgi:hypothetical protein
MSDMYFRNTKNRRSQSQSTLRTATRRPSTGSNTGTYGIPLPDASYDVLLPCIRGMTGGMSAPNMNMRSLHTVGVWSNHKGDICRCAFVQPELASATCTIPASKLHTAQMATRDVAYEIPFAEECRVGPPAGRSNGTPQISGRMAPYVVSKANLEHVAVWGFGNMCKTKLFFFVCDDDKQIALCPTRTSMVFLKTYMPEYAVCIYDDNMSCYRITVSPDSGNDTAEPNKNTSLIMYGDGSLKLQGKPASMERVCSALHDSVHAISRSRMWERFLRSMVESPVLEDTSTSELAVE